MKRNTEYDKALIIGIQYLNNTLINRILKSKINSEKIFYLLKDRFNVNPDNIKMLGDWFHCKNKLPTYENIIKEIKELINYFKEHPNCYIYLFYIGKGLAPEKTNEILEIMVTSDNKYIYKNELQEIIISSTSNIITNKKSLIFIFFDSCHCGTIIETKYIYFNNYETETKSTYINPIICINLSNNFSGICDKNEIYNKAFCGYLQGEFIDNFIKHCNKNRNIMKIYLKLNSHFKKKVYLCSNIQLKKNKIYI